MDKWLNSSTGSAPYRDSLGVSIKHLGQNSDVKVTSVSVAGVACPLIEQRRFRRSAAGRGVSLLGTSGYFDLAAERYEGLLELFLKVAQVELCLRRLAHEIRQTSSRVNALAQVVVPRLESERRYIALALEEREREETTVARRSARRRRTV